MVVGMTPHTGGAMDLYQLVITGIWTFQIQEQQTVHDLILTVNQEQVRSEYHMLTTCITSKNRSHDSLTPACTGAVIDVISYTSVNYSLQSNSLCSVNQLPEAAF